MEAGSSSLKRQREEEDNNEDVLRRQKSYKDIITLLEEEEDEPNEDLSSLISTLQEEIEIFSSSTSTSSSPSQHGLDPALYENDPDNLSVVSGSGVEETDNVMRHLLEASDDELGLPNTTTTTATATTSLSDGFDEVVGGQFDGGDFFFPEGLWEFEDREAANYYSLLQATEIFM